MSIDTRPDAGTRPAPVLAAHSAFRDGARAMVPMLVALVPLTMVVGQRISLVDHPVAAWLGSFVVYSAGAQLASLDVLAHGSGWLSAAGVGILVNLRLAAYATSIQPEWSEEPLHKRMLAAVMLADPPWALARGRRDNPTAFYLGAAVVCFVGYPTLTGLGALVGAGVSHIAVTQLLSALSLSAVIAAQLRRGGSVLPVTAAFVASVLTIGLPSGAGLGVAGVVGGVLAWLTWRRR
jgi:predicted branched-subunit amino acid permease